MATDFLNPFVSNDPFNPWPHSASLTLSSSQVTSRTLTLSSFEPDSNSIVYSDGTWSFRLNSTGWTVRSGATTYYTRTTTTRDIPDKTVYGLTGGWGFSGSGTQAGLNTLYILASDTDRTDYERRRRINLEG